MRPSKITVIVCSFILITCAVFLSKFFFYSRCLNPDDNFPPRNFTNKHKFIGDSPDNVEWLLQISDIHISQYHDESRITDFVKFCNETIDVIQPRVVIASGDLTDAKSKNQRKSGQYEEEWVIYKNVLNEANISQKVLWLDIRGNHALGFASCSKLGNSESFTSTTSWGIYYSSYSFGFPNWGCLYWEVDLLNFGIVVWKLVYWCINVPGRPS